MVGNGVSFVVRIRNEEETLEKSVRSLGGITFPHEIVLILHRCTDRSAEIADRLASENPNIRIMTYDMEISRPGYEMLATDADSKHSLVTYYNWWIKQAKYTWVFKWDADFVASPVLINFMNSIVWEQKNMNISIVAKNLISSNRENYLCGGPRVFKKHVFWEDSQFSPGAEFWHFSDEMYIEHASELKDLKAYWTEPAWYLTEDSDEARLVKSRMDRLTADFGPEPPGLARASNPECDPIFTAIASANECKGPDYVNMFS
uniref:Glycosyltransferase n=1 Tax=viral metagenome TaxID=1070528 RepID=A0A6C0B533_9ZZZZ